MNYRQEKTAFDNAKETIKYRNFPLASKQQVPKRLVLFTGGDALSKGRLLNALVRCKLPNSELFCSIPSLIVHGNTDNVKLTYTDPTCAERTMPCSQFKKLCQNADNQHESSSDIEYITVSAKMKYPNVSFADINVPGYDESDTSIIRKFYEQADAFVMVFTAFAFGTVREKFFIQTHFAGLSMRNVFCVITGFEQLQDEYLASFSKLMKNVLGPIFTDQNGYFDEALYNQRVFAVDAYLSECVRTGATKKIIRGGRSQELPVFPFQDNLTGVPVFENALLEYISSTY